MMRKWIIAASQIDVVLRSFKVSLVVGSLLTLINHGDAIWLSAVDSGTVLKIVLTYCVPYGVSTYASVSTQFSHKES